MSTKPATQPYIPPSQRDKAATSSPLPSPLSVRAAAPVSLRKQAFTLGRPPASQEEAPALASAHSQDRLSPISELPGHVCLCQPEPKIPRPRNAFILYRSHRQAQILADNPKLSNPEVSKIAGEQWQAEPDSVKQSWKKLADEEKARHQQQYPDYRYQPKKGGRGAYAEGGLLNGEKYRCNKCGGRSIRTPSSGFPSAQPTPTLPPPTSVPVSPGASTASHPFLPMMNNLTLSSPHPRRYDGRMGPPPRLGASHIPAARERYEVEAYETNPLSPDAKRRRFNPSTYEPPLSASRINSASGYTFPTPHDYPGSQTAPPGRRRESLPPPGQLLSRQGSGSAYTLQMPPTPRSSRLPPENLTLPPLQHDPGDQSRSVEAMIMTMSNLGKITLLNKISPAFRTPGPTSPSIKTRGTIIAIEGDDYAAASSLATWLEGFLTRTGEFSARLDPGVDLPRPGQKEAALEDYLDVIRAWHAKSHDMISFITKPVGSSGGSAQEDAEDGEITEDGRDRLPLKTVPLKPVIIIPGYQVRASDAYASRIPIRDAYSPADHWQWMATMWRGIVGADLTIFVKDASTEEMSRTRSVEIKEEEKVLLVRKGRGQRDIGESTLRRVGFETGEWATAISKSVEGGGGC